MGFLFLTSGFFLGWALGSNDHANVFGAAIQSRMIKFKYAAIIASIFVILGAVLEGNGGAATLNRLGSVNAAAGAFTVALATAVAVTIMNRIKIPVSTSQVIVGAIIGWNLFAGMLTDYNSLLSIVMSWVVAPVLSAAIAFALYQLFRSYLNRSHMHLLHLDNYNRWGFLVIGAFGAYSLGANNIANVIGIFVSVSPFHDIRLFNNITITGLQQLYFWGAVSIAVGICTYSKKVMSTVGTDLYKLSPITGLIVVLAESIVLYMFGSRGLQQLLINLHLPTIPLVPISSSQAVIGAVIGIGLTRGGRNIHFNIMGKISLGWVSAPLLACLLTFVLMFFVQNVFEQPVVNKITYAFNHDEMVELQKLGIDIDKLATVNGRSYQNTRSLRSALDNIDGIDRDKMILISNVTQLQNLRIDIKKLYKELPDDAFSSPQWVVLNYLHGKTYNHQWQLEADLAKLSPEWRIKPKSSRNQVYNSELKRKYKLVSDYSKVNPDKE